MSAPLPMRLVRFSTRNEHASTAMMPPKRLLTMSMTINADPASAQIVFAAPRRCRRAPGRSDADLIVEAGLLRASRKRNRALRPGSQASC
jgi:hypothetical protein